MPRTLRVLQCADYEPTMLFSGASTFVVGIVLLINPRLFVQYPQTFGLLAIAAPQVVWGYALMAVGIAKWVAVEKDHIPLAFWTTIIGMMLWISITGAIVLLRQYIPLIAFTVISGAANCWLCIQVGNLWGRHEQHHSATPGHTHRGSSGDDHSIIRDTIDAQYIRQRRPNRVSARSYARQRSGVRAAQRVRG